MRNVRKTSNALNTRKYRYLLPCPYYLRSSTLFISISMQQLQFSLLCYFVFFDNHQVAYSVCVMVTVIVGFVEIAIPFSLLAKCCLQRIEARKS